METMNESAKLVAQALELLKLYSNTEIETEFNQAVDLLELALDKLSVGVTK